MTVKGGRTHSDDRITPSKGGTMNPEGGNILQRAACLGRAAAFFRERDYAFGGRRRDCKGRQDTFGWPH